MSKMTDKEIRACIARLSRGEATRLELKEGNERGGGRLVLIARKMAQHVTTEWYVQWHREGRRQSTKIGTYPSTTLAEARQTFREDYLPAILTGKNPTGVRSWTKRREATVKDLFEAYTENLPETGATEGSVRVAKYCLLSANGAAAAIGPSRPASEIQPDDILPHLARIHARGSVHQANNARAFIRAAFEFGRRSAHSYHEKGSGIPWGIVNNPAALIASDPAAFVPGQRYPSEEEFRDFWNWLTIKGQSVRYRLAPALQLIMATGQRPSEILRLSKASYDQEAGLISWTITKNKRPHCIPLPRQGVEILASVKAGPTGLFFARRDYPDQVARYNNLESLIHRYIKETGVERFTARDLRRTWKTHTGAAGLSKDIRDRLQNHALTDVASKHYDRYDYLEEMRAAMVQWERHLARMLTGDPDGVVRFARPVRVTPERPPITGKPNTRVA